MNYENGETDNDQITILFLGSKRAGKTTIKEVCAVRRSLGQIWLDSDSLSQTK